MKWPLVPGFPLASPQTLPIAIAGSRRKAASAAESRNSVFGITSRAIGTRTKRIALIELLHSCRRAAGGVVRP